MNIYCLGDNWVLTRMGRELSGIKEFPDLNYYIPYSQFRTLEEGKTNAVLYTHYETANHDRFVNSIKQCDIPIAMSEQTAESVRKYTDKKVYVIMGGTDFRKELTFGVVGRTYPSGRKGEYLIKNMVNAGYKVMALGQGWPCKIYAADSTNKKYDTKIREEFYSKIDYLVVPSLIEGGPIPVIDALGLGVPVIAPNVGWCWDYSVIRYEKGNWNSLNNVLKSLTPPTWKEWKEQHLKLFRKLRG